MSDLQKNWRVNVKGTLHSIVAWDPKDAPVKVWTALGSAQTGPPSYYAPPLDPLVGRILDVIEELDDGNYRRTFWRLP